MGVPKFFRWLSERYPKINQPITCRPIDEDEEDDVDVVASRSPRPTFYNDDGTPALFVGREHRRRRRRQRRKDENNDKGGDGDGDEVVVVSAEEDDTTEEGGDVDFDIDECVIMPEFDRLYLDMNGIIHGCSHNNANHDLTAIGSGGTTDGEVGTGGGRAAMGGGTGGGMITREDVVDNVCYYLDRIVGDIVKPKDIVYVAIDGVAPRAKLNQQRSRRFRSGKESEIARRTATAGARAGAAAAHSSSDGGRGDTNDDGGGDFDSVTRTPSGGYAGTIHTGGGGGGGGDGGDGDGGNWLEAADDDDVTPFHSNSITPGTPFLEHVSDHVLHFIRHKMKHDPAWRHLKVYYNGPDVPGEGEHKIMQFIRDERNSPDYDPNTRHCLYGQDGDLIMLGLATHEPHFCLLREEVKFGPEREKAERAAAAEAAAAAAAASLAMEPGGEGDGNVNVTPTTAARESIHQYTHNSKFELLHMSILRDYLALEFETSNIYRGGGGDDGDGGGGDGGSPYDLERTIDDFVFLTFFVGNDFLPHMPALDIADGAFDLLFHTYKKHRKRWQREAKAAAAAAAAAEGDDEEGGGMAVNDPYLTYAGTIVGGSRLEHFLADVGRHEDPVLHRKKRGEKKLNKRIRKDDRKRGRTSSIPSRRELDVREKSQREKYREMLQSMEKPSSDGLDVGDTSFSPVVSSTLKKNAKRKHSPPQMTEEREMTSDVERGVFSILASLVRNSISPQPESQGSKRHPLAEIADSHGGPDSAGSSGMVDAAVGSGGDDDDDDESVADYDDLKGRYYFDKFGFTPMDSDNHRALRRSYVEGLVWCLDYYYGGCPSWEWYYPYHYGPMLSDLADLDVYLEEVSFKRGEPLRPFEQLLGCLPPSSSYLLPKPYRWLMTSPKSPIREYYPKEFTVDMNGKRYPWEAVVLLPFIDAQRLIDAARTLVNEETLTFEERGRNNAGQAVLIQHDKLAVDNLPAAGESKGFGRINACHTRALVYNDVVGWEGDAGQISGGARFRPEILPGATLPHPGFPTLTEAPVQGLLRKKLKLNIFGTPSRYLTAALLMDGKLPDFPSVGKLGKKFVGTTVHFRYPFLQEGFVTAVSDSQQTVRGLEPSRAWTEEERIDFEERRNSLEAQYRSGDGRTGSGGWLIPQCHVVLSVRPLKGLETLPGSGGSTTFKVYSEFEVEVPLAAALWSPTYPDPRFCGVPARLEKNPYAFVRKMRQGAKSVEKDETCILLPSSSSSSSTSRAGVSIGVEVTNSVLPPLPPPNENLKTAAAALVASSIHREAVPILPTYSSKKVMNKVQSVTTRSLSSLSPCARQPIRPKTPHGSLPPRRLGAMKGANFRVRGVVTVAAAAAAIFALPGALPEANGAPVGRRSTWMIRPISKLYRRSINGMEPESSDQFDGDIFVRGGHVHVDDFISHQSQTVSVAGAHNCPDLMPKSLSSSTPPLEFSHGTTTVSFIFNGGIIAAVDSRASIGSFVGSKTTQKVLPINKHILGTMAGGAADCSFWIRRLRSEAKLFELDSFEEGRCISVARASRILANALYANRALKLSVGTMIMGYDYDVGEPSIYYVSDSGARIKGDMFAVGSGSTFALGILDTERRFDMSESEAIALAIRAIRHATFRDAYSGGYIGVYVITRDGWRKVFSEDLALITEEENTKPAGKDTS